MELASTHVAVKLRSLALTDANALVSLLNEKEIWDNLRDALPKPYTRSNAESFIEAALAEKPVLTFGITYKGALSGITGLKPLTDIYRHTAEVGYWVGKPFWGKRIATHAVGCLAEYAFVQLSFIRLVAGTMAFNRASQRVLEKCGFQLEGIHQLGILKNQAYVDEYFYALLNPAYLSYQQGIN